MPNSLRSRISKLVYQGKLSQEDADRIRDALEKQIPKKLINFSCPVCSHYFEDGDTRNYCPNCGQRLE